MLKWLILAALTAPVPAQAQAQAETQSPACRETGFDGATFTACEIDMAETDVRLFLDDPGGAPYGSFNAVDRALRRGGGALGIAMNAGMYHSDRSPVGHYVENGETRRDVVTSAGPGNFGMLPNGVLCLASDRAAITESRAYAADPPSCTYATQSGPMLVIDGALHPRFLESGTSRYVRNGAGVSADGRTLWLAISDERVNFHTFARFFRDGLGARNALYFDGNVSRLYDSGTGRHDGGVPMGPIIGTVRDTREES